MKLLKLTLYLVFSTINILSYSQQFAIEYQQCMGGSGGDGANDIVQLPDSTYIILGGTTSNDGDISFSHGGYDFWLVNTDKFGNLIWEKTFGGSDTDVNYDLHLTTEGDLILFGSTQSNDGDVSGNHGGLDYWVVKTDGTGNLIWQRCLGSSVNDYPLKMNVDEHDNIYVIGNSHGDDGDITDPHGFVDYWIAKLNTDGELLWDRSLGGTGVDWGTSICITADGGYIAGGSTTSDDGDVGCENTSIMQSDIWIVKLDSMNNIQWEKCYGGSNSENAIDIKTTEDGGYIIAGGTNSNDGDVSGFHGIAGSEHYDFWIFKIDSLGNIEWQNCFGGTKGEASPELTLTSDGGFIISGHTNSHDGDVSGNHSNETSSDIWLFKLNSEGELIWQQCFGSLQGEGYSGISTITETEFIIASGTSHVSGDVECDLFHPGPPWDGDVWFFKIVDTVTVTLSEGNLPISIIEVYPNPAQSFITFEIPEEVQGSKLEIYNIYGMVLATVASINPKEIVDIQAFIPGIYFYRIWQNAKIHTGRFVVI